jgi:hypothetical protein
VTLLYLQNLPDKDDIGSLYGDICSASDGDANTRLTYLIRTTSADSTATSVSLPMAMPILA